MNKIILVIFLAALISACSQSGGNNLPNQQDEPVGSAPDLSNSGYKPVVPQAGVALSVPAAHSLPWPVAFQDAQHEIGNSMAEFQPFGTPYWHGGCDLRVNAGTPVYATVGGKVEAGHYSYATNADGSMTKYWLPYPASGNDTYFEVGIIGDDGNRYEFHHVSRTALPANIIQLVQSGGRVSKGDLLGYAIAWSDGVYHHIHYNIVAPNGVHINPEFVSPIISDTRAPDILGKYAVLASGAAVDFANGVFAAAPKEFVIEATDYQDENIYAHPPTWARLKFASGEISGWDFHELLVGADGKFANLWSFFASSLLSPSGVTLSTTGGYGTGVSLVRLPVPAGATGGFTIEIGDQNNNVSTLTGSIAN